MFRRGFRRWRGSRATAGRSLPSPSPLRLRLAAPLLLLALVTSRAQADGAREFDVVTGTLAASAPGVRATVSLSILPRAGFRLFADGPLLVRLAGDGVTPERALLRRDDAVDPRADAPRFELPFRRDRTAAGDAHATLTATLTFYLCDGHDRCHPVTEPVYIRDRTP